MKLKWQQAPIRTAWGDGMVVASVAIDKDHTVCLYCEREQIAKVEVMFTSPAAQPQQEPVAAECKFDREKEWVRCSVEHHNLVQSEPHKWPDYQTRLLYTSPPARQEPAFHGFMDEERCCVNICYTPWAPGGPNNELPTAYYTSPPAQRKPLTDEEIESINVRLAGKRDLSRLFARAIEAAHNIKENT